MLRTLTRGGRCTLKSSALPTRLANNWHYHKEATFSSRGLLGQSTRNCKACVPGAWRENESPGGGSQEEEIYASWEK